MNIDPEVSLARKGGQRERFERAAFLSKVRARFLERAARMGLRGGGRQYAVEDVHAAIVKEVLPLLLSVSDLPAKK
jgi:thymidylate kinase